ncbi:GNAT family N-acetyltransferase [Kitasatospora sp. NPDC048540]|uniref:GNAT family N-acetyltransferase n=1 Tax=Kitasatospora sp. NPDC048540 TaxID=3155634 RepID=UPI0033DE70A3
MQRHPAHVGSGTDLPPHLTSSPVQLRAATLADFEAITDLIGHIDLKRRTDDIGPIFELIRTALATGQGGTGPFTHGSLHFVVAEHADHSGAIGLVRCGVASWTASLAVPSPIRNRLYSRIGNIQELAVAPEHRGRGIAHALLHRAEADHRAAGYDAIVLRHQREQTSFYTQAGYTSGSRLTLLLPGGLGRVSVPGAGWRWAVKPLVPPVSVVDIHGSPALTGLLSPRDPA